VIGFGGNLALYQNLVFSDRFSRLAWTKIWVKKYEEIFRLYAVVIPKITIVKLDFLHLKKRILEKSLFPLDQSLNV
jgi:hypothetical protein